MPHRSDYGLRGTSDSEPLFNIIVQVIVRDCCSTPLFNIIVQSLFCLTLFFLEPSIGCVTEEVQHQLAQVVLLNGFQTDPNRPGTEKIVGCAVQKAWLSVPPTVVKSSDFTQLQIAGPGELFLVKGWNRSVVCLGVLMACWQCPELLKEGNHDIIQQANHGTLRCMIPCSYVWEELPQDVREHLCLIGY